MIARHSIPIGRQRDGKRRARLHAALFTAAMLLLPPLASGFGFDDVAKIAAQRAATSYKVRTDKLPDALARLDYDQFRDIRFKPERSLWRPEGLPFEIAFFHEGQYFKDPVKINELVGDVAREIRFSPELFDYGANAIDPRDMRNVGFAGFRVHYAINSPKYKDEVLVFLGASYFRALGKGQRYGLSARGLAVDTALGSGEEFPQFVEFWIRRPSPGATELTIFALLDSRRVTGAYSFVLKPGVDTAIDVKARIFLREFVSKPGFAPLTTMYFFGENQHAAGDDYRPEVHDSDGLSIASGTGEWIWRPLVNPKRLLVTSFTTANPSGFGISQRDRDFEHYEDMEARYDLRPSAWIEPKGLWGTGRVELVQIPSPDETNDNIVAYWVPDRAPAPQQPYNIEYRILWQKDGWIRPPTSWVTQTRRGRGFVRNDDGSIGFVIDFDGPALRKLPPDAKIEGIASADANAEVVELIGHRNEVAGGWRLALRVKRRDQNKPVELRAYLRGGNNAVSETWSYILPPD